VCHLQLSDDELKRAMPAELYDAFLHAQFALVEHVAMFLASDDMSKRLHDAVWKKKSAKRTATSSSSSGSKRPRN
jgi:hypothetical protein